MKKEMLINVLQPEESRIAIIEDGVLEELYVERSSQENYAGNIYKGRIVNLEPSIQAAFVDFGVGRNGFLHVSDVDYQYYKHLVGGNGQPRDFDDDDEEDDDVDDEAVSLATFTITRAQAMAFVRRSAHLVSTGRPPCALCGRPLDPDGHVCIKTNGHLH